jgi:isochorismate hydrolase
MKEEYLHIPGFEEEIDKILAELTINNYRPKPWKLHPGKAALLVLDMQNYFLDPASHAFTPSAPAIVPNIKKLILMARRLNMEIIFTRHVNNSENAGMMGRWWKDVIRDGTREAEIFKSLGCYYGRTVGLYEDRTVGRYEGKTVGGYDCKTITKNQYDAFYNTDLEEYLRTKNLEQVIICGLLANLCCETTVRSAFVRGFEVFFPVDATAAYNRDFHISTFRNLGFGFCPLMRTSELISSVYEN